MCLLTNKLTKEYTRKNQGGLDCSQPGSLAPALLYFTVTKGIPAHTFGMQLTRQQ
jgi:hypothetical protein